MMANPNFPGYQKKPAIAQESSFINPFEGSAQACQRPHQLDLGAGALSGSNVLVPPRITQVYETDPEGTEVLSDVSIVAKRVCGQLAEAYVNKTDPTNLVFPQCSDLKAISEVLKDIINTPLGLGFGQLPDNIINALSRFTQEVSVAYRKDNGLGSVDLVPLGIKLPAWLESTPKFDILAGIELADVTVEGKLRSMIASRAKHCRITFMDEVLPSAFVGFRAKKCTVIFNGAMRAQSSFIEAEDCTVNFNGGHPEGDIGPMTTSRVECTGVWRGSFLYKGSSTWSSNVKVDKRTDQY